MGTALVGMSQLTLAQDADDPIAELVSRLELESYKATLKGLTQFGDRRQGTSRNRAAVDWIEEQLISYGCSNVERLHYTFTTRPRGSGRRAATETPDLTTPTGGLVGRNGSGPGGSSIYGYRANTGVNRDLQAQPDERIRLLNAEEPVDGPRSEVYCTKIGTTRPDEMYIVSAHMDGHGVNEAVNDDGSARHWSWSWPASSVTPMCRQSGPFVLLYGIMKKLASMVRQPMSNSAKIYRA